VQEIVNNFQPRAPLAEARDASVQEIVNNFQPDMLASMHEIADSYRNHATLFIYYAMRFLVILAALLFLAHGDWESFGATLFVAVLMFIPSFIKARYRIYLPFTVDLGIVAFIFISLFLGNIEDLYGHIQLWDKFVHFQSGLLLSVSGFVLIYTLNETRNSPLDLSPGFVAFFAVVFSLAFGALWEIVEFALLDHVFGLNWQASLSDTMWDLIADGSGALVVSTIAYFWMYRHKRLPFTPKLLNLMEKIEKAQKAAKKTVEKSIHELRKDL
jgi:hypothetical protein